MLLCNPELARLLDETVGEGWITDLKRLQGLVAHANDDAFQERWRRVKLLKKEALAGRIRSVTGIVADPGALFDVQVKRIHEYKRQHLNALFIISLYQRLRSNPQLAVAPRCFVFGGKAAPGYAMAKLIIRLINGVAEVVNNDPAVNDRLKVVFLPDFNVKNAHLVYPAADLSEQISTAGKEASGTGNMKFMMNGALTLGTRDGATIEMAEEAGEENFFLFGLTAQQVADSRAWYNPHWHYENEQETKNALDLIASDFFNPDEPGAFASLHDVLLKNGDRYMHLADLSAYLHADEALVTLYADRDAWAKKAILNVAGSGKFSSDRAIAQYASEIWQVKPCPIA
jgi:starch phosphorylase